MLARSLLLLGCLACTASAENLVVNGDFENGTNGFSSDYIPYAGGTIAEGVYDTARSPHADHPGGADFADHTSGNGLMLVANGSTDRPRVLWRQTIPVDPSHEYAFSGWAASWGMDGRRSENPGLGFDPCPSIIAVSINGVDCGHVVQVSATNGLWEKFAVTWDPQGATSANIELRLLTTAGFGNDLALDDLGFYSAGTVQTPAQRLVTSADVAGSPTVSSASSTEVTPLSTVTGSYTSTNMVDGVQIFHAVEITWPSIADRIYQVQSAASLDSAAWTDLGNPVSGTGTTNAVFDPAITTSRFYRVVSFE